MAGLLDSKRRIMDTIVTAPARSQAAAGHMQIRFATFTDRHTFYETTSSDKAATDASDRVYFEASRRFQDTLCLETDPNGLVTFENYEFKGVDSLIEGSSFLKEYLIISSSFPEVSGNSVIVNPLVGGTAEEIVESLTGSYSGQHFLSSKDLYNKKDSFLISTSSLKFSLKDSQKKQDLVDDMPNIWQDSKFSHLPNYLFLPPINKVPSSTPTARVLPFLLMNIDLENITYDDIVNNGGLADDDTKNLINEFKNMISSDLGASYYSPDFNNPGKLLDLGNENVKLNLENIQGIAPIHNEANPLINLSVDLVPELVLAATVEILGLTDEDFVTAKECYMGKYSNLLATKNHQRIYSLQKLVSSLKGRESFDTVRTIDFLETSRHNNVIMQFFEFKENEPKIRKLAVIDAGEIRDENRFGQNQKLYHVGKIYQASNGTMKFVNIFTIMMSDSTFLKSPAKRVTNELLQIQNADAGDPV